MNLVTLQVTKLIYRNQLGTSLVVQWLGFCASTAGDIGLIPGRGTKIPHATWHVRKIEKKRKKLGCISIHNNELHEREIKETIPFSIESKRIKYLGIKLPKEVKDPHWDNYKTLTKETEDDTNPCSWIGRINIVKMTILPKIDSMQSLSKFQWQAFLVVQWLSICLLMQGTRVRAQVWEDPTCHGATRPMSHNYWACTSGACVLQ